MKHDGLEFTSIRLHVFWKNCVVQRGVSAMRSLSCHKLHLIVIGSVSYIKVNNPGLHEAKIDTAPTNQMFTSPEAESTAST